MITENSDELLTERGGSQEDGDPIKGHKVQIANLELLISYMRDGTMKTVDFDSEGNKFDTTAQSLEKYQETVARLREALAAEQEKTAPRRGVARAVEVTDEP